MTPLPHHEQLLDLLVLKATDGLSADEKSQLAALLAAHPDVNDDAFEHTLATLTLAAPLPEGDTELPPALAARILAQAATSATHRTNQSAEIITLPTRRLSPMAGWWSAAACLLLAITGWWPRLTGEWVPAPTVVTQLSPEQQRDALLKSGHAIQASWSPGNDAAGNALVGDVVFDPATQTGFLRFKGIPANDPRLAQYQLWIADAARPLPEPVDGGVFNAPTPANITTDAATGDVIIPFEAKLPVGKPAAFVVTVEQPGGVVVSRQERVLALAKVL